jgi:hypothetical protein
MVAAATPVMPIAVQPQECAFLFIFQDNLLQMDGREGLEVKSGIPDRETT